MNAKKILTALETTVGQKIVAALSGLGLIGFVVAHLAGNLQVFVGAEALNKYAEKLHDLGPLLWVARIGLLAIFTVHIVLTIRLALRNRRRARSQRYAVDGSSASTRSSRLMAISGSVILAFVIFHLLHFTFGYIQPEAKALTDEAGRPDVYSMLIQGFQNPLISGVYIVGMLFLVSHLSHATYSLLQTLGVSMGGKDTSFKRWAAAAAFLIVAGFVAIPIAVLSGFID